jgi:hypothetical protein
VFVTDLVEGGMASGSLALADRIEKVNGIPTSAMDFDSVLAKVANSLVLMLECARLKTLASHTTLRARAATLAASLAQSGGGDGSGGGGSGGSGLGPKNLTISHVLPNLVMVSRRPSVGRAVRDAHFDRLLGPRLFFIIRSVLAELSILVVVCALLICCRLGGGFPIW